MRGEAVNDPAYQHRYAHQSPVLHIKDKGEGGAKLFLRDNFRYGRPHGGGHKREGYSQNNHDDSGKPPLVQYGHGKQHVHDNKHERTNHHQRSPFPDAVVERSEQRRQQDCPEGQEARNYARQVFRHVIFIDHQLGGKFQEGEYAGIEQHAENGNEPKAFVGDYHLDVAQLEALFLLCRCRAFNGSIQLSVHYVIDEKGYCPDTEHQRTEQHGSCHRLKMLGKREAETECESRTDTCQCHLQPHRQRQLMPAKPFHDYLADRHAGDLHAHTEYGKAQPGNDDLRVDAEDCPPDRKK
ncbi:hypothetical protein Barb6_03619 [Bacteroidales bacterium Barb6]|nr:hypothetical protein Barb6_03619 [Bacteroidales bacterium Barb6]